MPRKKQNPSRAASFADIDSEHERLPASAVKLTAAERKLLKDPDWIDEEEGDLIIAMRIDRAEGDKCTPIREYLKRRGIRVEG